MKCYRITCVLVAALCAAASTAQGHVWTVDDDGPADFNSIAAAIASPLVAAWDVLQVHPGGYAGFTLDKPLDIIGKAGPGPTSFAISIFNPVTVSDIPGFTLAGMDCTTLDVRRVSGPSTLDNCGVGVTLAPSDCETGGPCWVDWGYTQIEDCPQLLISRSTFLGTDQCYPGGPSVSRTAVTILRSTVAIVDCYLEGGGAIGEGGGCLFHYPSDSKALVAKEGSDVTVAGSSLTSGWGAWVANNPPAISVEASNVRVRGSASDIIRNQSPADPAIDGTPGSSATVSGVTLEPPQLPAWVNVPVPAEPYLMLTGSDAPGALKQVELYGPPQSLAIIAASLHPALFVLAPGMQPIWLDPGAVLKFAVLVTVSQEIPATYPIVLPLDPSLSGIELLVQAWLPPLLLDGRLTNPASVVLRW